MYIKEQLEKCITPLYLKLSVQEHKRVHPAMDEEVHYFVRVDLNEIISVHGHYLSFKLMNDYINLVGIESMDEAAKKFILDINSNDFISLNETREKSYRNVVAYQTALNEFAINIELEYEKSINYIQRLYAQPETKIINKIRVLDIAADVAGGVIRHMM